MSSNLTLTQSTDFIYLEYIQRPLLFDIRYSGSFDGEIFGNNVVGMNRNRIIVCFISNPEETFMEYYGNLKIISLKTYGLGMELLPSSVVIQSDEIRHLATEMRLDTTIIETYDKTNKYNKVKKTRLTYSVSGIPRTINNKNRLTIMRKRNG